ncbi:MAG TPA: TRAP transporter large permease [Anaerohalosphaeraceae bacterium]|jgi:tripartite ATP-independent transporter DctM subunit|nr:TRAP transporter large permease [Anaerohalosphaeraceae bacterium]HQG04851.1 TRAP transporter large permease [Anaerohalosphaeraceae bacterium]HQI08285.1 TRAP transporter large permease [Anaerohalosphaeraceae bacterium]HQJ68616.1 TRAP transporter large permease [Anaerohalosphaeraceae bacterium]
MSVLQIGLAGCLLLLVLLLSSMPVAIAMMLAGTVGFAAAVSPAAAMSMLTAEVYDTFTSYSLTVIPLFVLMGQVAFHTGISRRLFHTAYQWMGHWPGGMAISTVGACTAFGAICGSGPATAATMASVVLPEMKRYGYDMKLAAGTVAAGGTLGMMIPPSVVFIVYAILTEQSIGQLFIAGIGPGILMAVLFCLTILMLCRKHPQLGPAGPRMPLKEKLRSLAGVSETLILFFAVIGGMFAGLFTPTEAAAIGAAGAIVIALFRKKLTLTMLSRSLQETVRTSCMVMFIVTGAVIFGRFLAITRIPYELASFLASLPLPAWVIMGFIILFYLAAGCFVDALGLVMLTIPIFYPVVLDLGFDPIWFGVIIVAVTQMGVITPPVGVNVYVVGGIERDIPLQMIFEGALPFLWALIVSVILLILFPQIALFLPHLIH